MKGKVIDRSRYTFNLEISIVEAVDIRAAAKHAKFHVIGEATAAYRRSGSPTDETPLFMFCKDYLERKNSSEQGEGYIVTLRVPTLNKAMTVVTREIDKLPEPVEAESCFVLYDYDGNELYVMRGIVSSDEAWAETERLIDSGVITYTGNMSCRYELRFTERTPNRVFKIEKTIKGKNALGKYLLFGIKSI